MTDHDPQSGVRAQHSNHEDSHPETVPDPWWLDHVVGYPLEINLSTHVLGLRAPIPTAHGPITSRTVVLVSVGDGAFTGWGEASPIRTWSAHDLNTVTAALRSGIARLQANQALAEVLARLRDVPEARAALAGALVDLAAKRAGLPIAAMLADDATDTVNVNAVITAPHPDTAVVEATSAVTRGVRSLKVKVAFASPAADLERVAAIRDSVGPRIELRLDANGGWNRRDAVAILNSFVDFDIAFCEEPVTGIVPMAAVAAATSIPVAVDESARCVEDIAAATDTGSIAAVVVKPQGIGGPDIALQAIDLVRSRGVTPIVTTMIDSAVGVAHAAHVAAAAHVQAACGLDTSALLADDVGNSLVVINGRIKVPPEPGLGVAMRQPFA